jgi:hypothetical protein
MGICDFTTLISLLNNYLLKTWAIINQYEKAGTELCPAQIG